MWVNNRVIIIQSTGYNSVKCNKKRHARTQLHLSSLFVIIFPFLELRGSHRINIQPRDADIFKPPHTQLNSITIIIFHRPKCMESTVREHKWNLLLSIHKHEEWTNNYCATARGEWIPNWVSRPVTLNNPHKRPNDRLIYCVLWLVAWRGRLSHTPLLSTPWLHASFIL